LLYLDLPTKEGVVQQDVIAKWAANAPLAFIDQYVGKSAAYRAAAIDVSDQDGLRTGAIKLHDILDTYGIANSFEIYSGTHYQRCRGPFPESCDAVLQQEPVLHRKLPVSVAVRVTSRPHRTARREIVEIRRPAPAPRASADHPQ
jgi:hypothetical protein